MNISDRQRSRHGRLFLVLMLVATSFLPESLHALAMAGSQAASGGGHHAMMGHMSGDQPAAAHHLSQDVSAGSDQASPPVNPDDSADLCCPATCFVALCAFEPETADLFVPDSFENESTPEFIVVVLAAPERPPRA